MKKILWTFTIVFITCVFSNAQEDKGKYAFDINLNPASLFDANAGAMFQMPNIKARYFYGSDIAIRLGLGLGFSNDKNFTDSEGNNYSKTTSSDITLSPGIEKEMGSDKFFGYIGVELPFSLYSYTMEQKVNDVVTKTKNPFGTGYFGIGLNAVIGFDYYILGNLYVGAELSPGFMFYKYSDTVTDDTVTNKGGTGMDFALSSSSGIRLGVRF